MKKTELVEIIQTIVREEINRSLPQLLMEVLAEKITANSQETLTETRTAPVTRQPAARPAPVQPRRASPVVQFETPIKQAPVAAPKLFSTNPALNAVLNETVGGLPSQEETDSMSAIDTVKNLPQEVLAENTAVAAVAGALTRDYSKLLKAVESKVRR